MINDTETDSSVWLLIPVHNRQDTTRACLERLRALGALKKYIVCVIEDGSTDGTAGMLSTDFPTVRIVEGSGQLYWGGGIAKGMETALADGAEVMVWLNDDCLPDGGSLELIVARARLTKGVCGGVCFDPNDRQIITYSGAVKGRTCPVRPKSGEFVMVDGLNGNLVAIHADTVKTIGVLDAVHFPHYGGDDAYCIKAKRAGIYVEIAGSATAINPRGLPFDAFGRTKPASAIFNEPFRVASCLYWPTYFNFIRLSYGWLAYIRWPAYFFRLFKHWLVACRRKDNHCHRRLDQ